MGYIFSVYSLAVIFLSPQVGKMITIMGRRNLIMYGLALMGTAFILFGVISRIDHKPTFIGLSLLIRFLQGFSSSMI